MYKDGVEEQSHEKVSCGSIEKFVVRTVYKGVEAHDASEAESLCREGEVGYDEKHIEEGDEEWLKTVSVEQE